MEQNIATLIEEQEKIKQWEGRKSNNQTETLLQRAETRGWKQTAHNNDKNDWREKERKGRSSKNARKQAQKSQLQKTVIGIKSCQYNFSN